MWSTIFTTASVQVGLLLFSAAISAHAQRAESGEQCFSEGGQAQARQCLQLQRAQSEATLRATELAVVQTLNNWQEHPQNKEKATAAFHRSSVQFLRYRQEQCELQASLAAGGTGTSHRRLLCEIALNEGRIAHLASVRLQSP